MQFRPSPLTQEHRHPSPRCVPPAQWGNHYARESGEEECELFGDVSPRHEEYLPEEPAQHEALQVEQPFQVLLRPLRLIYRVQDASMVSL